MLSVQLFPFWNKYISRFCSKTFKRGCTNGNKIVAPPCQQPILGQESWRLAVHDPDPVWPGSSDQQFVNWWPVTRRRIAETTRKAATRHTSFCRLICHGNNRWLGSGVSVQSSRDLSRPPSPQQVSPLYVFRGLRSFTCGFLASFKVSC